MKLKFLFFYVVFACGISQNITGQCTVSSSTNASALTCGVAPLSGCGGVVYIGDGSTAMTLSFNATLDLSCLGAIQLVVRNAAALDFSPGNNYLILGTGSSLILQSGCNLIGGSCNASERIYIGTDLIASCNGNGPGADYSFQELLNNGGYNIVTASGSPAMVCGSGSFTLTASPVPSSGATIKWYTVASGGSPIFTGNPYTTPVVGSSTTYYVEAYYSSNGMVTPRAPITVTVNPLPATPTIGTLVQPACTTPTGSITVNNLPASGTWTLNRTGTSASSFSGTGTSTTISGLAPGTYFFSVSNGTCTSGTSVGATLTAVPSATWNGASWSIPPTASTNLVFNGNFSSSGSINGCKCNVNSGAVVINSGHTLHLVDDLTVSGGSLTFNNASGLLQDNAVTNTGNISYNRNSSPIVKFDFTYWASPTSGAQTLLNFSPNTLTDKFFTYHNNWMYAVPASDTFAKGIGYAIRAPQNTSPNVPTVVPHQFVGVPNNGNVDVAVTLGASLSHRLVGNPYPSTLDADSFIINNAVGSEGINQTISGTLYFWTHNHGLSGNNYLATDYATYNLSGGTAVATGTGNTTAPTQYIPVGQGFFVNTVASGNVSFRNFMRTTTNGNNFYKTSGDAHTVQNLEKHRIWLNMTNESSNFSQALLGYIQNATNEDNPGYDGLYFGANEFVLYTLIHNQAYTIQGRALPFSDQDEVPLGYKTNTAGNVTLAIDHVDGLFAGTQSIVLEDKLLHVFHDLKAAPYLFYSEQGTFNDRFVLKYVNPALHATVFDASQSGVNVYVSNHEIHLDSALQNIKKYTIYNVLGQTLVYKNNVNSMMETVVSVPKENQVLLVSITLDEGQTVTQKIIF